MVNFPRWLKHAFLPPWRWRLQFGAPTLKAIENAITRSEVLHRGEIRFAIENALAPSWVWHGLNGRRRAAEVFSNLRLWDTEENTGVLIYVLIADREIHILADRGISRCVDQNDWDRIAQQMQTEFGKGQFQQGAIWGIEEITHLLARHFPAGSGNPNELPDRPVIIRN